MKKILAAVSAIGLLASTPAFAQATGEIKLSATVAKACGVGDHRSGASADPDWDQSDISVALANGTGQFNGESFTNRSFGNVWCNAPASVTLSVGALTTSTTTADVSSFTSRFDIRVKTDAGVYVNGGEDLVLDTATEASGVVSRTASTAGAFETGLRRFSGADTIEVLKDPTNRRAVAGDYTGYIRFTATAL
ncbi:hypothetical protein [Sphingopyxis sp. KK2]|uniref:hypothetical protein n=1 Tax=Sphingopyxis sp. KK2 TaxID=1855727 RepID=UPI0011817DCC|nr:hypothetical protein [Sphingopyxis sp. KK2]